MTKLYWELMNFFLLAKTFAKSFIFPSCQKREDCIEDNQEFVEVPWSCVSGDSCAEEDNEERPIRVKKVIMVRAKNMNHEFLAYF